MKDRRWASVSNNLLDLALWRSFINILEADHFLQTLLIATRKTASCSKDVGVFECSEKSIPDGEITEVVPMNSEFMVDRMMLRALDKKA